MINHVIKATGFSKGKAVPLQAWTSPEVSRSVRLPEFQDNLHKKFAKLSTLSTGRLYQPGDIPDTHCS